MFTGFSFDIFIQLYFYEKWYDRNALNSYMMDMVKHIIFFVILVAFTRVKNNFFSLKQKTEFFRGDGGGWVYSQMIYYLIVLTDLAFKLICL